MSVLATLITIAAWCGQPVVDNNSYLEGEKYYTSKQVDQCRQNILTCLDKTPHNPECFKKEKLYNEPKTSSL